MLLASAAAGCSSDVTRFNGIFSSKTDDITTNSIPHQSSRIVGTMPTPDRDVAQANQAPADDVGAEQPMPVVSHETVSTSTDGLSGARASVAPIVVEKSELSDPTLSEPKVKVKTAKVKPIVADETVTGTVPKSNSRWQVTDNSPRITVGKGEDAALIARRYGVPERELLKANGLKSAKAVSPGDTLVIPTFGNAGNLAKAKVAADEQASNKSKKVPVRDSNDENVAILPTATSRDKSKIASQPKLASSDADADKGEDGIYIVKPGDSLARIAKQHSTTVEALKAANGMETAQIRIGQKLRLSDNAPNLAKVKAKTEPDATTTATIPKMPAAKTVAEEKVATATTVKEDPVEQPVAAAPSKYRWPVQGAVLAAFGANVDGERNTGIDISVPEGTPVKAAADGTVIYSGAGLKELGNTVLVRHEDGTVTVYGNASELKVARGQKVQRGQIIAVSGKTGGAKEPKLHFEVRKNASPVNPATYLE